jgi:hypothetical protein
VGEKVGEEKDDEDEDEDDKEGNKVTGDKEEFQKHEDEESCDGVIRGLFLEQKVGVLEWLCASQVAERHFKQRIGPISLQ